jgi:enoyl-CoA hydratase
MQTFLYLHGYSIPVFNNLSSCLEKHLLIDEPLINFNQMEYKTFKVEREQNYCLITIDRPESLNALNSTFFHELDTFLFALEKWSDIRVLIITGTGKAFVAGADIAEMVDKNCAAAMAFSQLGQKVFHRLESLNQIVIAAINGFALGGGLELAMACDFRIASTNAKFGQPEVNLGLIPGYAGTQRLPRLVGLANALFMLTTGEMITSEEALRMGLIQKAVDPENLMPETLRLAGLIASKGPKAVTLVKNVVRKGYAMDFEGASLLESESFGSLFGNEGLEGMKAFLEKRKPIWN